MTVDAPAKLNLSLRVLGRRDDGYHDLESVFLSIGLYDTLVASPRDDDELALEVTGGGSDVTAENNLVLSAAKLFRDEIASRIENGEQANESDASFGADFLLTKRIPSQAGLAGGSSDAIAAMIALSRLWNVPLSENDLHRLAATLGSDLNFFAANCDVAIGRGRGEEIEPLDVRQPFSVVVAKPPIGASTAEVFAQFDSNEGNPTKSSSAEPAPTAEVVESILRGNEPGLNDLLPALLAARPEFGSWLDSLDGGADSWQLTGSGTAVFRFERTLKLARRTASQLVDRRDGTFAAAVGPGRRTVAIG